MTGRVVRIQRDRGFGFVRGVGDTEYFFHRSACRDGLHFEELSEGSAVEFDEAPSDRGPRAGVVRLTTVR